MGIAESGKWELIEMKSKDNLLIEPIDTFMISPDLPCLNLIAAKTLNHTFLTSRLNLPMHSVN